MSLRAVPAQLAVVDERVAAHTAHVPATAGVRGAVRAQAAAAHEALAAQLAPMPVDAAVRVLVQAQRRHRLVRLVAERTVDELGRRPAAGLRRPARRLETQKQQWSQLGRFQRGWLFGAGQMSITHESSALIKVRKS